MFGARTHKRCTCALRMFTQLLYSGLVEKTKPNGDLIFFKIYVIALSVYAGVHLFLSFLLQIPTCHRLTNQCDQWLLIRFVKWMHQEHYYVGRGMYERTSSFTKLE
ncbi:unnamed protein product [Cuscuta campestris]|uniref:Uncharacterized protein n=1 Tax=Cuscuta campestris TaxID=132261 RepID=A0A484M5Q3_9ASTE|nr:unnamed protein product [Cuscuta campestris]